MFGKPTNEEVKKVIREYVGRMFKLFEARQEVRLTDDLIECPECSRLNSVLHNNRNLDYSHNLGRWYCLRSGCGFQFPPGLAPLNPTELKEVWNMKQKERRIGDFLTLLSSLGIKI